jgi:pullulanase/glycogen debranching enzyme
VRAHVVALSYVVFTRGLPFFAAGGELLRSKSGDRDSYDSGDWFNRIFWDGSDNNWGAGLPPRAKNGHRWAQLQPLLADPALKPTPEHIAFARARFFELLEIRQELDGGARFDETERGLIVMHIGRHTIAFNASARRRAHPLAGAHLHPAHQGSSDPVVRRARVHDGFLSVPGRTTAVFVNAETGLRSSSSGH